MARILRDSRDWIGILFLFVMAPLVLVGCFDFLKRHNALFDFLATAGTIILFVIPTISFFLARRTYPKPDIRLLLLLQILIQGGFIIFCIWGAVRGNWAMIGLLIISWRVFRDVPFCYKLGKMRRLAGHAAKQDHCVVMENGLARRS